MKKIVKHIKDEWYKYGLETFVVVIGILMAFALNNWNESRKRAEEELKVLEAIRNALQSDLSEQFDKHLETHRLIVFGFGIINSYVKENKPFSDTLGLHLNSLSSTAQLNWTPNLTAFSILESKGIDLIQNDNLMNSILNIYNQDYPRITNLFDNYTRNIYEYGRPLARSKFTIYQLNNWPALKPLDYESLRQNPVFLNTIYNLRSNAELTISEMENFEKNVENVIEQIDEELGNR